MGLREDIQTDIGAAFDGDLADAVKQLTLIKVSGSYVDGENVLSTTEYTTRGALVNYSDTEVFNEGVHPTDVKAIILTNELGAEPEIDDKITCGGKTYKIINVASDPADAHWSLQCRR